MTTEQTNQSISVLMEEEVPGGAVFSCAVRRHHTLRLTAIESDANVGAMLYNLQHPLDRLNIPDTLKAQHTAKLTTGHALMSDMGHVLCSISADTCGWHDPLGGHSTAALVRRKYGPSSYQESRNAFYRNARDQFLIELGKWGLGKGDLVANINFFSKVTVDDDGRMQYVDGNSIAGTSVDLRAEMDTILVLNTCQHPMDPNPRYTPKAVKIAVWKSDPPPAGDPCRIACPENARAFILTEALFRF
jgi:urea carboxylase-associated protein 2